ncbi:serine/threonine/tyrosine-interacting-like protein 1 isoform X1 [Lates japonicus]|uniref:Serine/threonine/tyrosine-interacting-like protein 1 isoform X1 n=1 Tax=Lates japonicus TaxID=270547 RepID=A0AAD3M2Q6_LATJO|nr:serine/threonine/tyrosine-interacting-like protein 1 isoform X1 [Lates japonicus]
MPSSLDGVSGHCLHAVAFFMMAEIVTEPFEPTISSTSAAGVSRLAEINYLCLIGRAVECAQALAKASLYPVHIELENLKAYPVEVIAGLLYMGNQTQGMNSSILRDLEKSVLSLPSHKATLE